MYKYIATLVFQFVLIFTSQIAFSWLGYFVFLYRINMIPILSN